MPLPSTPISPIPADPAATTAASDFQNYLSAVDDLELGEDVREHVDERLKKIKKKDGQLSYPTKPARDLVLRKFDGYRDSELGGSDRLGNSLDPAGAPKAPPTPLEILADSKLKPEVTVTPIGTITHTDPATGKEIHEAHDYMHEIFDHILYQAQAKLEDINARLQSYCETPTQTAKKSYEDALKDYEGFRDSFQNGATNPSPYATAFNGVKFKPVVTNEGFTVSLRVQINWKNPRHSSSTIKVP